MWSNLSTCGRNGKGKRNNDNVGAGFLLDYAMDCDILVFVDWLEFATPPIRLEVII